MQKQVFVNRNSIHFVTLAAKVNNIDCVNLISFVKNRLAMVAVVQNSCDYVDGASPTTRAVTPRDLHKESPHFELRSGH